MTMTVSVLLFAAGALLLANAPQFGATGEIRKRAESPNFRDGKFRNIEPTNMAAFSPEMRKTMVDYFSGRQEREPTSVLPAAAVDVAGLGRSDVLNIHWFGHSTCLIELDGKLILTDPVFSDRASPVPFLGPKRFEAEHRVHPGDLPGIDIVLISHDHYDHLDYRSIRALKDKVRQFLVPLGVGDHLRRWGVPDGKILEFDWWQGQPVEGIEFTATPARHFSGRRWSRDRTLWCSWVVEGRGGRVFFGGDSGYHENFRRIGELFGPFDLTLLECGAYNRAWAQIHMIPEEAVQAHLDLKGRVLMPIHWGSFNLALHPWNEPVERLLARAAECNVRVVTPCLGGRVNPMGTLVSRPWWRESTMTEHEKQAVTRQE
jgi:L-ascorbate metabolism protein UlaG (beta-lactamase superfamily)